MLESENQFRSQFDPNSQKHHKGDTTIVPVGGVRVPESMPSMFPEGYDPSQQPQQQVIDYGQEYRKIEQNRNVYQNFKNLLLNYVQQQKHSQDMTKYSKKKVTHLVKNIQKHMKKMLLNKQVYILCLQKANLTKVQQQLREFIPKLDSIDAEGAQMSKQLISILQGSNKKYQTKQSLTDFNFKVKKTSTKSFSQANKCLQKLKDIKKNYKKPQTQVTA